MSNITNTLISDIEMEDWSDSQEDDQDATTSTGIDCRRMVENKLADLRLSKETDEFNFDV